MTPIIPQTLYDAFGFPLALRDYPPACEACAPVQAPGAFGSIRRL